MVRSLDSTDKIIKPVIRLPGSAPIVKQEKLVKTEKRMRVECKHKANTANTAEKYEEESDGCDSESDSSE